MQTTRNRRSGEHYSGGGRVPQSLLNAIGVAELVTLVWRSIPFPLRFIALPYSIVVYRRLLATSNSLEYLYVLHREKYSRSLVFRLFRPRYRKVRVLLQRFEKDGGGASGQPIPMRRFCQSSHPGQIEASP